VLGCVAERLECVSETLRNVLVVGDEFASGR
jgi:hypothetical protein